MDKELYDSVKKNRDDIVGYCMHLREMSEAFRTVGNKQMSDALRAHANAIANKANAMVKAVDDNISLELQRDMEQINKTLEAAR